MMKTTVYVVLKQSGAVRMTKGKPPLARDEIAIGLRLSVPDSAFLAPIVFADLDVPDHAVIVPEVSVDLEGAAQGMEARSDETLQAAQPEGQQPGGEAMRPEEGQ